MEAITTFLRNFYHSVWFRVAVAAVILLLVYIVLRAVYRRVCRSLINVVAYSREFSADGVYQGESVTLTETLYNRSFFPLFFVDIEGYIYNDLRLEEYDFDPKHGMQLFVSRFRLLLPYMQVRRRHEIKCAARGHFVLESVEMLISGSSRFVDSRAELCVYPALLDPPTHPSPASALQGDSYSHRWLMRDPFTVSGVRDYCFGDPFNSINFKATARCGGFAGGGIKVNNRDFCSNRTIMVYINFQSDPDNPVPGKTYNAVTERFLSYAAGILREAAYNGYKAGFAANCTTEDSHAFLRFPVYSGELHFRDILRAMSRVRCAPGVSFTGLLDEDISAGINDTELYVFTLYTDSAADARLRTLRRMGNTVNLAVSTGEEDEADETEGSEKTA